MMDYPLLIIWENVSFQSSLLKPHFWAGSLFGRLLCGKELINIKDMCGLLPACVFQGWLLKLSIHCCCLIGFLRTRTPGGLSISWKYRPASASSGLGDLILSGDVCIWSTTDPQPSINRMKHNIRREIIVHPRSECQPLKLAFLSSYLKVFTFMNCAQRQQPHSIL